MEEGAFLELVKDNERQILHVCRYYSAIDAVLSVEDLFQEIVYTSMEKLSEIQEKKRLQNLHLGVS